MKYSDHDDIAVRSDGTFVNPDARLVSIIVPAAVVSYSYTIANTTINATTMTNELEIRTNDPGPVVIAQASSSITSGSAFGKPGHYIVTVTNDGAVGRS